MKMTRRDILKAGATLSAAAVTRPVLARAVSEVAPEGPPSARERLLLEPQLEETRVAGHGPDRHQPRAVRQVRVIERRRRAWRRNRGLHRVAPESSE